MDKKMQQLLDGSPNGGSDDAGSEDGGSDDGGYSLRPQTLDEFIGQAQVKEQLRIHIEAAKGRGDALEHILFVGPPGLGKTTLARIVANEMGSGFKSAIGPIMERVDLAAILTNLEARDVLFVDEIHRMRGYVQESMYPAMEDYRMDLPVGQGPTADIIAVPLARFTLIGATTREGLLTGPFRERFGIRIRLDYYTPEEVQIAIKRLSRLVKPPVEIEEEPEYELARRSRGTMRVAGNLLKQVRDYATVRADGVITYDVAQEALEFFGIDELGLDMNDKFYLQTLIEKFNGRAGLKALATALSEDDRTIEEVYEPYLIKLGFVNLTKVGRIATEAAYEHLGYDLPATQLLF